MMSDIQGITKLEFLPNEVLIECLEYLNAFEIVHAFDQLNHRLNSLICNIPLHIDFQNLRKSVFDQFCRTMMSNPGMKNQVYSIKVSNEVQCFQCNQFLSYFAFNEFTRLRKVEAILPSLALPWLWERFQLQVYLKVQLDDLLFSELQTLSITCLNQSLMETDKNVINLLT